jgi:hypothetical protein
LLKAVRKSGLSLSEISTRLKKEYGVTLSPSGISHAVNRGTIRFQRALQILAIGGVPEVQIEGALALSPER